MFRTNSHSTDKNSSELFKTTPDFKTMIRITFWSGLGFIFFMFLKSYVVIYYFGGSGIDLGVIMSLQPLAGLFSMPLIAYLTDRTSKKRLVLVGSMGRTIAYFLYWISLVIPNLVLFGIGTFVQGLLVGFFWPPFFSLISEKSFKGNRTQALATGRGKMIGYGFLIGAFISIPIFALVSIFIPENIPLMYSPLLIFAIINLIAGYHFYKKVDENLTYEIFIASLNEYSLKSNNNNGPIDANNGNKDIENLKSGESADKKDHKSFYIGFFFLILGILATSITGTIYSPFVSAYLIESLLPEFSERIIPIIVMIVYFPAQVLSQLVAAKLGKSYDRTSPLLSVIVIGIFKALMIWLLISALGPIDFAIVLIFLYIAAESNGYLIQAIMSRISIKHRGKIFGLNMWIDRLGRVIGPLIGGILWDTLDYNLPFIISIYMGLCLIPIFMVAIRKLSPHMKEQVEIDKMGIIRIKKQSDS
ncbi:MAG: MFS transporter [Candidatus Lokiarchaeota archaeon]|nr:MFS transporter [Candidatus Lokiarchaeota archaeon]